MTVDELIDALEEQRRITGGDIPVGKFADEFGTWHEIKGVEFLPHKRENWPTNYSPPVGGGVTFK